METPTTLPRFQLTKSPFTIDNEVPFTSSPFPRYINRLSQFSIQLLLYLGYDYMDFTLITLQKTHYPKINAISH